MRANGALLSWGLGGMAAYSVLRGGVARPGLGVGGAVARAMGGLQPGAPRMPGAGWWPREAAMEQSKHSAAGAHPTSARSGSCSVAEPATPPWGAPGWTGGLGRRPGAGPLEQAWLSRPAWPVPLDRLEPCFALFVGQAQLCYWR